MNSRVGRVLLAGAAGTVALEATTYLDVALRGRAPSNVPERVVGRIAEKTGFEPLEESNTDEIAEHRRVGASAMLGYLTGFAAATAAALLWAPRRRLPLPVVAIVTGAAAMAISDIGATALGVTDPSSWDLRAWLADAIPHAVFGVTTAAVLDRT